MMQCPKCYRKIGIAYNELCYQCYKKFGKTPFDRNQKNADIRENSHAHSGIEGKLVKLSV